MEKKRIKRIEMMLQKEINELFRLQTQQMNPVVLISVTRVQISSDLSILKNFLSIYPTYKSKKILQTIQENKNTLRYDLGKRIRKYIRHIPELFFFIDNSLDYIEKIDYLLSIKK